MDQSETEKESVQDGWAGVCWDRRMSEHKHELQLNTLIKSDSQWELCPASGLGKAKVSN